MKEAKYTTSSIGQIAFLLWNEVYPEELTFEPFTACLYFKNEDYGELIDKYWRGVSIPVCELSECINVAEKILRRQVIEEKWFEYMKEAIKEVREDYIIPSLF